MANICNTFVTIEGKSSVLRDLQGTFTTEPLMYKAMEALGAPNSIDCKRAVVDSAEIGEDGHLHMQIESAWNYPDEVFDWLEEELDVEVFFQSEEPGMQFFVTNDAKGKHFPSRWHTDVDTPNGEVAENEFETLEDALTYLSEVSERTLESEDDVKALNDEWIGHDNYIILDEYELV